MLPYAGQARGADACTRGSIDQRTPPRVGQTRAVTRCVLFVRSSSALNSTGDPHNTTTKRRKPTAGAARMEVREGATGDTPWWRVAGRALARKT